MTNAPEVRVLMLRAAGTNCDAETAYAFTRAGATVTVRHIDALRRGPRELLDFHILALPGGFSYGDDIAAGRILADRIARHLAGVIGEFVATGGLVIGICNGFQVLVKAGLLPAAAGPGLPPVATQVTLTWNTRPTFVDRWCHVVGTTAGSPWIEAGTCLALPVAHGEGRLLTASPAVLEHLQQHGQVALRYARPDGRPATDPTDPANPNGSVGAIAGLCDPTGRILGLMPHPERHVSALQHPHWTRRHVHDGREATSADLDALPGDGLSLFARGVAAAAHRRGL